MMPLTMSAEINATAKIVNKYIGQILITLRIRNFPGLIFMVAPGLYIPPNKINGIMNPLIIKNISTPNPPMLVIWAGTP